MDRFAHRPLALWRRLDTWLPALGVVLGLAPVYLLSLLYYGGSPETTDVGYRPKQPVAYSHALHVGELGLDCRYCHSTVERAAMAAIPPTRTCMNCHAAIFPDSPLLAPVRESYASGRPVPWVRVHDLPDYAFFNHSAHVRRGVGCVECHGRVDTMEEVIQVAPLSMGWCLDCHRDPETRLRPPELVTDMAWSPPAEERSRAARAVLEQHAIRPSEDCSTCHR